MWRVTVTLGKLWAGGYGLRRSIWVFLVLGSWVMFFAAMAAVVPFLLIGQRTSAIAAYVVLFWGYYIMAAVGTWRAANARISPNSLRGGGAVVGAKLFILFYTFAMLNAFYGNAMRTWLGQT